jgi:two-component system OmpR family sensor kinase
MKSLRKQLALRLFPLYLVVSIIAALTTYFGFGRTVRQFMDDQLMGLAEAHAAQQSPVVLGRLRPEDMHEGRMLVQIFSRDGALLATACPEAKLGLAPGLGFQDVDGPLGGWRVYALRVGDHIIQTSQPQHMRSHTISSQTLLSGLPVALLIPISAYVLWMSICFALRPLDAAAQAVAARNEHDLRALPTADVPCEVLPLVEAMNRLLLRLNDAFAAQRRFVQDAAHELRTPITALNLQLENLKSRVKDTEARDYVQQLDAGLSRTMRLVEQLLRLARQEAPVAGNQTQQIELSAFARDAIAQIVPLADERDIEVGMSAAQALSVTGVADDLRCVLHNLLDNAFRYTPRGGAVEISLRQESDAAVLEIADTGPGVPPEVLPRLFDRFYRIEGTQTEGSGLGLAIAKHAAERNGWRIVLVNRTPCTVPCDELKVTGLIARLVLPMPQPAPRSATPAGLEHTQAQSAAKAADIQPSRA